MRIQEIGQTIRAARLGRDLTQAELASRVGISRETLSLLEGGRIGDLGIRKVLAVMEALELALTAEPAGRPRRPDYVRMAARGASVSFRTPLGEDELVRALLTGRIPAGRGAHLRALFDEAPLPTLKGLAQEASKWARPGRLQRNLWRLAHDSGASRDVEEWLTIA